jgi:S-sulfosulfanyl-L-cysteine sulfohydrolase
MISRREFMQVAVATAALTTGSGMTGGARAFAQQKLTEKELLAFESLGNVTLVHVTDIHGQLMPLYFREPSTNLGVGDARGQPPHLTGKEFLTRFGIPAGSSAAYALTSEDFEALAKTYGRIGGLDRAATVIKAIRAERGERVVLLDGGDTWQGSWSSLQTRGQDMIDCMALLKPDAMTGHWEFTYGTDRVKQAVDGLGFPFLGLNIRDTEWNEPAFEASTLIERGGVKIAVLGQAFPYTPVANPRWMIPTWSFGVREEDVQGQVDKARKAGADLVVLLSHNGFDVDRKLASRVKGLDVILTGHTHDALPEAVKIGKTLLIASGSSGKFVSRLDLDVKDGEVKGYRYKLIPLFSDVIAPDAEIGSEDRRGAQAIRRRSRPRARTDRDAAVPARQFQRDLRRPDLPGTAAGARCGDRAVARLPLGHQRDAGTGHHLRGCHQRDRDHLSRRVSDGHDRHAPQGDHRGRRR